MYKWQRNNSCYCVKLTAYWSQSPADKWIKGKDLSVTEEKQAQNSELRRRKWHTTHFIHI